VGNANGMRENRIINVVPGVRIDAADQGQEVAALRLGMGPALVDRFAYEV
jgi:hypothetical protein